MKPTLLSLLLLMAVGCTQEHSGEIMKSCATGKIYQMDWRIGALYYPKEIDSLQLSAIKKAIGDTIK